ncbi:MAG: efflux RND transporter permease subunit [Candidatus Obscuribacterales bacterium]|nr:efflux RND transporter permease subunit [Candidatus Obscuribacterales bacterium]
MWIVELALGRPYTFVSMAIAIVIFGVISIKRMAIDIFPVIDIPIVSCAWTYTGMSPYFMENMITTVTERALTSTINGIQRMESISVSGLSVIKVYLNKGTNVGEDVAMVCSVGTAILRQLPRGINPPFVTASSATDVPVIQLGIRSDTLNEAQLFDIANNLIRSQLATVQGTRIPFPYGGKYRQVMIDLDPKALYATQLSAATIVNVVNSQNVLHPTGTAKMGSYEYIIDLNSIPDQIEQLNNIPVKSKDGAVVFLKDVAHVHDGSPPQLNVVNINGKRGVLFNILKSGEASTLTVVNRVKEALVRIRSLVPPDCKIEVLTDQSTFVRECVLEVVREACTAAGLTALMILALLGSWRSTLIVATSIPLAILSALICLDITGQTINSMTLGGLALAVGMLVDDATVEIENVHRNMAMGKDIVRAILDGAQQVALPAAVSTMSICIVFVPLVFLTEPSRSLFVPLGMSVTFAMLASYGLSRTVVPLMSKYLLANQHHEQRDPEPSEQRSRQDAGAPGIKRQKTNIFSAIHYFIDDNFEALRERYKSTLNYVLLHPGLIIPLFVIFYVFSLSLIPIIGRDYFPTIDGGQLRLHVCAAPGTRVEETERIFKKVEAAIKETLPKGEIELVVDNIGLPVSGINYALSDSQTVSEADGEILVSLTDKRKHQTEWYQNQVRAMMRKKFSELKFYFQPADIVTQILNAGLPAPIDVKVLGQKRKENYELAKKIEAEIKHVVGTADVSLHQVVNAPHIFWEVDRTRAKEMGVTQKDVSNSFLTALSGSFQTNPNFWLNRSNRINYNLTTIVPTDSLRSTDDVRMMPISPSMKTQRYEQPPVLTNVASFTRTITPAVANHVNVQPCYDIYAACQNRDLGAVSEDIKKIVEKYKKTIQRGTFLFVGGQVFSMNLAFIALTAGLGFAVLLVYLLLVVNFQSWTDPLIILMAIPGALSGITWSLFITQTTFSIPALMGAIMTIGVASANSILMVTFANEQKAEGFNAFDSALNAGYQRFRPVMMTATAMIIGMIPMAIGGGQGGSQNAPIGRAVIGGLIVATFSTLFFVPLIFSLSKKQKMQTTSAPSTVLEP